MEQKEDNDNHEDKLINEHLVKFNQRVVWTDTFYNLIHYKSYFRYTLSPFEITRCSLPITG